MRCGLGVVSRNANAQRNGTKNGCNVIFARARASLWVGDSMLGVLCAQVLQPTASRPSGATPRLGGTS